LQAIIVHRYDVLASYACAEHPAVMTEQRPRMQSRAEVLPLAQGDAVISAVNERPVRGRRGAYSVKLRHGVSRVRSGRGYTAGIILHDAK